MINPIAPITPINKRIGPIRPIRPIGPSEKSRHPSCNAGCLIFVFGLIGRIGPMGPISCDGSYRFYGIDHDGAYRFYGIDFHNRVVELAMDDRWPMLATIERNAKSNDSRESSARLVPAGPHQGTTRRLHLWRYHQKTTTLAKIDCGVGRAAM